MHGGIDALAICGGILPIFTLISFCCVHSLARSLGYCPFVLIWPLLFLWARERVLSCYYCDYCLRALCKTCSVRCLSCCFTLSPYYLLKSLHAPAFLRLFLSSTHRLAFAFFFIEFHFAFLAAFLSLAIST